ncbi:efflux transporter outer membrane subunit [Sphingomonas japonica]|uniref:NodT family efflux transporter outer membrane factor (OMF) lipoprotein n=1 Tax=Sphingomonas japonica TaxID=511662 RepID=A0ABX0TZN2_9SPHN|nr:efflux transporter outer membrane subunit [Sphingomonas japonica]NIJ22481.1 NodT family efflux transporter outer membrane factor (OMF) lipoprotein [Sphingomonas japonica]
MKRLSVIALGLMASACAVGPDYAPPSTPGGSVATGGFAEAQANAAVSQAPLPDAWWRLYDDPAIDRLVTEALTYNTDVRQAAANLRRARAVLSEARGARLPTTDLSAQYTRSRTGGNSINAQGFGVPGGTTIPSFENDLFSLGFDASYELDLFGRVGRSIEAANADTASAAAQLDAARTSVAAETARAYAQVCSNSAQAIVARDTIRLQQQTVDLTRRLFEAGRGQRRDLERATALLAQTEADLPGLEAERRAALYALATLTGKPPAEIDAVAAACTTPPRVAEVLPVGDGAALIARRPDVRAAERQLAADTARIGVATAALYPNISLLGGVNLTSVAADNLIDDDSFGFSLGPLISWSFPNVTAARARIRQSEATAEGSLAAFDGVVLTALREVEQALARYAGELTRNRALVRAERASSEAARLSKLRFDYGAESFLQLIESEQERAQNRAALAASNAVLSDAQVTLFKALGGGWADAPEPVRRESAG